MYIEQTCVIATTQTEYQIESLSNRFQSNIAFAFSFVQWKCIAPKRERSIRKYITLIVSKESVTEYFDRQLSDTDECEDSPCVGEHRFCIDKIGRPGYICTCQEGYGGDNCEGNSERCILSCVIVQENCGQFWGFFSSGNLSWAAYPGRLPTRRTQLGYAGYFWLVQTDLLQL